MFANSGLSDEQQTLVLRDYRITRENAAMGKMVQRYLRDFPEIYTSQQINKGFALTGTVGIGKTMLATIIANELLRRRIPVIFVTTTELISELRVAQLSQNAQELEDMHQKLGKAPVVIFDDVGKEKPSEWVQLQYFRILDNRCRKKLATSFTSNYTLEQLSERFDIHGDAIGSRLFALTKDHQANTKAQDFRLSG